MKSNSGNRIPEFDGIRAIAIWMVILLHIFSGYWIDQDALSFLLAHFPRPVLAIFWHGWMGVDLFFLLSGFLITSILLDSKTRPHYFRNFYIRRFLRIAPLYFLVVFIWWLRYRGYSQYFELSSVFGANLASIFRVRVPNGTALLWSLAVEEHFYLLWPAIIYFLDQRKVLLLCCAILIGCPILRAVYAASGNNPSYIYLSWCRFDGLAAGATLAIWARTVNFRSGSTVRCIAVILFIGAPAISLTEALALSPVQQGVAAAALRYTQANLCFAGFFILVLHYRGTKWMFPLRSSFLQFTGALSYCLYLIHLSVGDLFDFLRSNQHTITLGPGSTVLLRAAFLIVVSYAIAAISRKFLEQPFLALKDRFTVPSRKVAASLESPSTIESSSTAEAPS
jgi:peptidoglycan/LPS O-acetylase OafA/YrhL